MRSFALFVAKTPQRTILATAFFGFVPMLFWLSSAIAALTVMRRGASQSVVTLVAGVLPALFWATHQNPMPIMCFISIILLGCCLRSTASWVHVLVLLMVANLLYALFLTVVYSQIFHQTIEASMKLYPNIINNMLLKIKGGTEINNNNMVDLLVQILLKGYAFVTTIIVLMSLCLARYWQSILYNPGGFYNEMRTLRVPFFVVFPMLIVNIAGIYYPNNIVQVALPGFSVPLIFFGMAVVHGIAHFLPPRQSSIMLFIVYFFLMFIYPFIIILACLDSLVDFRSKLAQKKE